MLFATKPLALAPIKAIEGVVSLLVCTQLEPDQCGELDISFFAYYPLLPLRADNSFNKVYVKATPISNLLVKTLR